MSQHRDGMGTAERNNDTGQQHSHLSSAEECKRKFHHPNTESRLYQKRYQDVLALLRQMEHKACYSSNTSPQPLPRLQDTTTRKIKAEVRHVQPAIDEWYQNILEMRSSDPASSKQMSSGPCLPNELKLVKNGSFEQGN